MEEYVDSNVFTVSPTGKKINLEPGQVYTDSITIANPVNAVQDFHFTVKVDPYSITDSEYTADLATITNRSEIVKWITIDEPEGTLAPNEIKKVYYTVTVPEDAAGGGQYAALMVSSADVGGEGEGLNVKNSYEIASIVYAEVAGEITHEGEITNNYIPGFVLNPPLIVSSSYTNRGNVHESARIALKAKTLAGDQVYPATEDSGAIEIIIMPDSEYDYTQSLDDELAPLGIYEVTQTITYLGQTSEVSQVVVLCPLWFIFLVLITIAVISGSIVAIVKKHKRKKVVI